MDEAIIILYRRNFHLCVCEIVDNTNQMIQFKKRIIIMPCPVVYIHN